MGEETNPYLQAQRIVRFVENKMRYKINDYERGRGIDVLLAYPVTDEKTGQEYYEGCCNQISALEVALCRAVGIPARCVSGFHGWRPWVPPEAGYSASRRTCCPADWLVSILRAEWASHVD